MKTIEPSNGFSVLHLAAVINSMVDLYSVFSVTCY